MIIKPYVMMNFDTFWEHCSPKVRIMRCGGISGNEPAPGTRSVFIHINNFGRLCLKSDGTYTVEGGGQDI